ncbi:unnamed protein product [Adineta ricciae]|uniref:Uncharacterized protein n=1 Tax=Adineta ricciae TaxID=249248 RepID=A0A813WXW8_ADIRI|nr:unnamed protein product [Adineta ricciae]CAF1664323.1 unnamed protein product [Adineta ricciae]
MNNVIPLLLLGVMLSLHGIAGQWYIMKKDYPSALMNYPNPGKRSIEEDRSSDDKKIDCSIPYSYMRTYADKTAWLLLCNDYQSPLGSTNDLSSVGNSIADKFYSSPRLISHERRTARSIPPYLYEQKDLFRRRRRRRRFLNSL